MIRNPDNMSAGELRRLVRKIVDELYRNDWAGGEKYHPAHEDDPLEEGTAAAYFDAVEYLLGKFGLRPTSPTEMEKAGKPLPFPCTCDGPIPREKQVLLPADETRKASLTCEHVLCLVCGGWLEMGRPGTCTKP